MALRADYPESSRASGKSSAHPAERKPLYGRRRWPATAGVTTSASSPEPLQKPIDTELQRKGEGVERQDAHARDQHLDGSPAAGDVGCPTEV